MPNRGLRFTAALVVTAASVVASCAGELEVLGECRSPDGEFVATFFREYGGGAAGWQWFGVQVLPAQVQFRAGGAPFEARHVDKIQLAWTGRASLEVRYSAGTVERSRTEASGASIRYLDDVRYFAGGVPPLCGP